MKSPTQQLAAFGADLAYAAIPDGVRQCAVNGILDTVGACVFGATLPWGRMVIDYAVQSGGAATSTIFGTRHRVPAAFAALANGALAHGCEIDNLRQPSVGVHPGAILVPAAFAVGEETGATGQDILTAYVAGFEVMARIGIAAHNTPEKIGFHSPALTGTFGAAIAAGRLLGLDNHQMTNALGIAGSLCSGLLAFSKAGNGGMVKRLHMGRAAEGGVLAARLARGGFEGPDVVLESPFGFFDCYTRDPHMESLVAGLGEQWETSKTCFKRYAAHVTAHTPVQALEALRAAEPFAAEDVQAIRLATSEKVLSQHAGTAPRDIASAQYSVPVCLAVAVHRDPNNPHSFLDNPQDDAAILDLARRVQLTLNPAVAATGNDWATCLTVVLKDGRERTIERSDFVGAPSRPMDIGSLEAKFRLLAAAGGADADGLLQRLTALAAMPDVRKVFL